MHAIDVVVGTEDGTAEGREGICASLPTWKDKGLCMQIVYDVAIGLKVY